MVDKNAINKMKVADLKKELKALGLDTSGKRPDLATRLINAKEAESQNEEATKPEAPKEETAEAEAKADAEAEEAEGDATSDKTEEAATEVAATSDKTEEAVTSEAKEEGAGGKAAETPSKSRVCVHYRNNNGQCPYGDKCRFEHTEGPPIEIPEKRKKNNKECMDFRKTSECAVDNCPFLHFCKHCKSTEHGSMKCTIPRFINMKTCEVCDQTMTEENLKTHLAGKAHAKRVAQSKKAKRQKVSEEKFVPRGSDPSQPEHWADKSKFRAGFAVGANYAGILIGKAGATVKKITKSTGCRNISFGNGYVTDRETGKDLHLVCIRGTADKIAKAIAQMSEHMVEFDKKPKNPGDFRSELPAGKAEFRWLVQPKLVPRIIGKGGSNIRELEQSSNAKLHFGRKEKVMGDSCLTILGDPKSIGEAVRMVLRSLDEEDVKQEDRPVFEACKAVNNPLRESFRGRGAYERPDHSRRPYDDYPPSRYDDYPAPRYNEPYNAPRYDDYDRRGGYQADRLGGYQEERRGGYQEERYQPRDGPMDYHSSPRYSGNKRPRSGPSPGSTPMYNRRY